uniref:Immunoglobulin subtype domain-containing protein n=1 Tax=Lates calcarifer TaxID=8187 RepID=A0A4W6BZ05_LATCA
MSYGTEQAGSMCFLILSVLLLTVLNSALAQTKPSGVELGAALTLRPTFSGSITGIVWKLNGDLVAEWLNNEFEYYGTFRDRTTLDPTTGELVVKNVAVADAGLYTVEINSNVQSQKYQVEVMKKVSKPTVADQTTDIEQGHHEMIRMKNEISMPSTSKNGDESTTG